MCPGTTSFAGASELWHHHQKHHDGPVSPAKALAGKPSTPPPANSMSPLPPAPAPPLTTSQRGTERKWTKSESNKLREYVEANGAKNWSEVARVALHGLRTGDQVNSMRMLTLPTLLHL